MTDNEFASYRFDAAGHIIGITQHLWAQATDTGTTGATTLTVPLEWHITYDARGRITAMERAGHSQHFAWDANGNRLLASQRITSDSDLDGELEASDLTRTQQQHTLIGQGSNQLLGFTQTTSRIRGSRTTAQSQVQIRYSLDAAGNLTHDGLRQFDYAADNRLARIRITQGGEAAEVKYLTNALGQRVFAGEPQALQSLPDEDSLGEDFITWLRRNFGWLFNRAQGNASLGSAFIFGDGPLPPWAVLGEYDNGSASGKGRTEYIWLPTADGAIPIAVFRNNKFFSIHSDHLGTPRQMRSEANQVLWQWPYSAFGDNPPSGLLKATAKPNAAITHQPLLKATKPQQALDLRLPGQYADEHAGQFYNLHRMYMASQGRYTQFDPIGLAGGLNGYAYVGASPLMFTDPKGLQATIPGPGGIPVPVPIPGPNTGSSASDLARQLERLFCQPEPDCWDLQQKMEEVAGELRQRHVSMTADVGNLFCTRPIGRFSWLGHQMKFNDKQRQLQKLIEQAHAKGCSVNGEYIKLASMDAPSCPAR